MSTPAAALIAVLRFYQRHISPALPPTCRFYPTCSQYAVDALREHGVMHGIWLTTLRLLRCGPWHPGGIDHVPPRAERRRPDVTAQTPMTSPHHEEQTPC